MVILRALHGAQLSRKDEFIVITFEGFINCILEGTVSILPLDASGLQNTLN